MHADGLHYHCSHWHSGQGATQSSLSRQGSHFFIPILSLSRLSPAWGQIPGKKLLKRKRVLSGLQLNRSIPSWQGRAGRRRGSRNSSQEAEDRMWSELQKVHPFLCWGCTPWWFQGLPKLETDCPHSDDSAFPLLLHSAYAPSDFRDSSVRCSRVIHAYSVNGIL